jgi:ABC-type bacteriocin/lantibiotic exporter with double-glycine peptidase domain
VFKQRVYLELSLLSLCSVIPQAALVLQMKQFSQALDMTHPARAASQLSFFFAVVVGLYLLKSIFDFLRSERERFFALQAANDLQDQHLKHFAQAQTIPSETIVFKLFQSIEIWKEGVLSLWVHLPKAIAVVVFSVGYLFYLDWRLASGVLIAMPLVMLLIQYLGGLLETRLVQQQQTLESYQALTQNTLWNMPSIKLLKTETAVLTYLQQQRTALNNSFNRLNFLKSLQLPLVGLLHTITLVLVGLWAVYLLSCGLLTTGDLLTFITALGIAIDPVLDISKAWQTHALAKAIVFPDILMSPTTTKPRDGSHLSFDWQQLKPLNRNLAPRDFQFPKTGIVVFKGASGSGKSSFLLALAGLIPSESRLFRDLTDFKTAYLPQTQRFWGETIYQHICLGRSLSTEQVSQALKWVGAEFAIERLEHIVSPYTPHFSGGELQRLNLAQALVDTPEIVFLDEPTSALDKGHRDRLIQLLQTERHHRLWVIVTHDDALAACGDQLHHF